MPLSDDTIERAVKQYRREYDCYEKLAKFVAAKCEREIVRANTIRAAVTSRAKAYDKLGGKLRKKYRNEVGLSDTVDDALKRVTDLAGVRISTYQEVDRDKVVEEIQKLFDGPAGAVHVEKKDKVGKFYRATHCQVALKLDDLDDPYDNLEGLTCEIQVCSLLAHVWNELEHDLDYKPTTGAISGRETDSLSVLGNLTLAGDLAIKQMFEANADRLGKIESDATAFRDVYDFVARMRQTFPTQTDFGSNAGQLYEDLVALGFDTPEKVRGRFLTDGYSDRSQSLLAQFTDYLDGKGDDTVQVLPESSDALLVLLLEGHLQQVVDQHPMGRGRGRPPRIASFAHRFQQMKEAAADPATTQG